MKFILCCYIVLFVRVCAPVHFTCVCHLLSASRMNGTHPLLTTAFTPNDAQFVLQTCMFKIQHIVSLSKYLGAVTSCCSKNATLRNF